MDFSRLPSYPDASPVRAPWWWRMPKPGECDWFATGLKALFVVGTLLGAFYLRSMVLTPPVDRRAAINAENFDRIRNGMREADLEALFGVPGVPVADPAWLREWGEQWLKWEDPTARERWIAVALVTRGRPAMTFVVEKKKNGF
jgi:hypothetical protein